MCLDEINNGVENLTSFYEKYYDVIMLKREKYNLMAVYWAFKTVNSALWTASTIWGWGQWMFWGTPETAELRMAKQNKERLDKMESKIDQMWAINAGLSPVLPMTESMIVVSQDQSTYHKHHTIDENNSDDEKNDTDEKNDEKSLP